MASVMLNWGGRKQVMDYPSPTVDCVLEKLGLSVRIVRVKGYIIFKFLY